MTASVGFVKWTDSSTVFEVFVRSEGIPAAA